MPPIPTLRTDRLVLRPFTPADLDALVVLHAEESFWWYPLRGPMSAEDTEAFLTRVIGRYESDGYGLQAVELIETGDLIGWAGLAVPHFLPEVLPAVEVGWRLGSAHRGQGLATEAGAAAVEFAFSGGGLDRLVSIYEPENVASGRVMDHLGFRAYLHTAGPQHGNEVEVRELHKSEWEAARG